MRTLIGIFGAAILFALLTLLRTRDRAGCTGNCAGCARAADGAGSCATDGAKQ